MADQNSQSGEGGKEIHLERPEIKLNEVFVGKRTLRYMYLYHPNVVSTEWDESRECTPLFLGSDVLFQCKVSRGNLPRVHAKHARKGLATKVNFPSGAKVLGIHGTARGVWFYSIQGTFKIAFDYYSREDQDGCLQQLVNMWRRQLLDPILKNEVQVLLRNEPETAEVRGLRMVPVDVLPDTEMHCKFPEKGMDCYVPDKETVCKLSGVVELVEQINKTIDHFILKDNNEMLKQEIELLKTYTSYIFEDSANSFVNRIVSLLKICLRLLPVISETENVSESSNVSESNNILNSNNFTESNNLSESNNFLEKEAVLSEIAQWLGTEFANYHGYVDKKVTAFKQKHIKSIENLPSAELLVSEVFPKSMQVLLCSWLQLPDAGYPSQMNVGSENTSTLFPVIQLILELANQNLLSGVAHVLYSRLIQSDSV